MKLKFPTRICAIILCAAAIFSFAGCKEVEEDTDFSTPTIAASTVEVTKGGGVNLPEGFTMPTEAGTLSVGFTGSEMFGGFTLLSTAKTQYFTTSGSITLNLSGTLLRLKNDEYQLATFDDEYMSVAVALFKKSGNETIYVGTAKMPATGETYTATFSGLDSAAEYRFVITYTDVPRTRTTGSFSVSGVTTAPLAAAVEDDSTSVAE